MIYFHSPPPAPSQIQYLSLYLSLSNTHTDLHTHTHSCLPDSAVDSTLKYNRRCLLVPGVTLVVNSWLSAGLVFLEQEPCRRQFVSDGKVRRPLGHSQGFFLKKMHGRAFSLGNIQYSTPAVLTHHLVVVIPCFAQGHVSFFLFLWHNFLHMKLLYLFLFLLLLLLEPKSRFGLKAVTLQHTWGK